jgi:hypothetical protein
MRPFTQAARKRSRSPGFRWPAGTLAGRGAGRADRPRVLCGAPSSRRRVLRTALLATLALGGGLVPPSASLAAQAGRPGVPPGLTGQGPPGARLLLDARLRYEAVEDAGLPEEGRALTGRLRLGVETGRLDGVSLLAEVDANQTLGIDDFNSGVNGRAGYPLVPDPNSRRVNRLHLTWEGTGLDRFVVGRQRLAFDDQRFVSNSGFRQNEQTFDAVHLRLGDQTEGTVEYAWAWQVNRTSGSRSPSGTENASLHLVRAALPAPGGELVGFAWFMGFDQALLAQSNRTLGGRYTGQAPLADGAWGRVAASFAHQKEYGDNPEAFNLRYGRLDVGAGLEASGVQATLSLERLGGDGFRGFVTPLTTGHGFQGFSGRLSAARAGGLADGLEDRRAEVAWIRPGDSGVPVEVRLRRHEFRTTGTGADLGAEWNVSLRATPRPGLAVQVEYADFEQAGEGPLPLRRGWITLEYVHR